YRRAVRRRSVLGELMRKLYFALAALCCLLPVCVTAAETSTDIQTISVDQIHTGMKGVAYTVFEGVKPEPMDVEVLGILKNINGPRGDIILIRLHGKKVEYTGVVNFLPVRSEEHTSELQSRGHLVCRL